MLKSMQKPVTLLQARNIFRETLAHLYDVQELDSLYSLSVEYITTKGRTQQLLMGESFFSETHRKQLSQVLMRLAEGEPLQYIVGETEFYGLNFTVNRHVLIPRQETELLIDLLVKEHKGKTLNIIDLGTGSGCIAISLKKNLPQARVWAVDISAEALNVARENAKINEVEIEFVEADILNLTPFAQEFDIIVSNPPYVTDSEKKLMKSNVLDFEPHLALFVPDNKALKFYEATCKFSKENLKSGGQVWLEINEALAQETRAVFSESATKNGKVIEDLYGKERFIKLW